jgi:GABA permease
VPNVTVNQRSVPDQQAAETAGFAERCCGDWCGVSHRVLVVVTSRVGANEIRSTVASRFDEEADVRVVAPASGLSRVAWLTSDEDAARTDAAARADQVSAAIPSPNVEAKAGDVDPLLAIEDALREFPADEIVVVTRPEEDASWLESGTGPETKQRFDLPVTHLVVS